MSSKRKSSEEDEGVKENVRKRSSKKKKKSKVKLRFSIHYDELLTADNRNERRKTSATLELDVDTSEGEIRNLLILELSQLRGKKFGFFTKDIQGKWYSCPCSPRCEAEDHSPAEWNASNIAVAARSNRAVHIKIEEDVRELPQECTSGYETTTLSENQGSPDSVEDEVRNAGSVLDYVTNEVPSEAPLEITEIVPPKGDVEGGYKFVLCLKTSCIDGFQVQFGQTDPIDVQNIGEGVYRGKVPASSIVGEVEVKIVKTLRDTKNTIMFEYTDENQEKKLNLIKLIDSAEPDLVPELLMALAKRVDKINLKSKEGTSRVGDSGGGKTHTLPLLRMIADTAARINAINFFEILFGTHVGCTLFKSFKDYQPPLEEIARVNGHEELALLLERKHSMFRDDEDDSDDGVDWKAISKAIGEYQARHDGSVDKLSLQSADSSENVRGYLADRENSTSLSSFQVADETCDEDTFEEELAPPVLKGREVLEFCFSYSEINDEKSWPLHLSCDDQEAMSVFQNGAESGNCHTNGENNTQSNLRSAKSLPDTVNKSCFHDGFEEKRASTNFKCQDKSQVCDVNNETNTEKKEESYTGKASVFKYPEGSEVRNKKEIEMGGDHTFLEGKIKLVVRTYSEPVLLPFDDAFGRNRTTVSTKEVEKLKRNLTSFPTKQIGDDEACCGFLNLDGLWDGYPRTVEREFVRRKLCDEMKSPPHFPKLPQEHSEIDCSLDRANFTSEYLSSKFEKRGSRVPVNKLWTEPELVDHSTPPNTLAANGNQNRKKSSCSFPRNNLTTVITVVLMMTLTALSYSIFSLSKGLKQTDFSEQPFPTQRVKELLTSNPCNKSQHWIENLDGTSECLSCQTCPPGKNVSPECGNSTPLPSNTVRRCVPCQLGKSFSNEHGTSVCIPCSHCAKDQEVIKNCSRQADIECGKRCYSKDRYYDESKGDCLKCSKCCNDDQDVVESECIGKLGSQSSKICSFRSSVHKCNIKATLTFVPQSTTESSQSSAPTTSSHTVTVPFIDTNATEGYRLENLTQARVRGRFASKSKDYSTLHISMTVTMALLVLVLVAGMYLLWFCKSGSLIHSRVNPVGRTYKKKRAKASNNSGLAQAESWRPLLQADGKACTSSCQDAERLLKSDSKPLRDLLDSSELEEICRLLDTPICGKPSYEKIACFCGASYPRIKAMPLDGKSEAVIAWLVAERPELTVREFASVVKEKARRADVADKLEAFDGKATKESTDGIPENLDDSKLARRKDSKLLSSLLESASYQYLNKICERLDIAMAGVGDYRDICSHYRIDHYEKAAVYERYKDGPSRALIDHLAATHEQLTVAEFVTVVREVAKRGDVAKLLKEYDLL